MASMDITLAERGQIVIPKAARDALGIKPGARLRLRIDGGRLVIEKIVQLDLSPWVGQAVDDGLTSEQALTELRGRPVPWRAPAFQSMPNEHPQTKLRTTLLNQSASLLTRPLGDLAAPKRKPGSKLAASWRQPGGNVAVTWR